MLRFSFFYEKVPDRLYAYSPCRTAYISGIYIHAVRFDTGQLKPCFHDPGSAEK